MKKRLMSVETGFKPIPGVGGYEANTDGQIRNALTKELRKTHQQGDGYVGVTIRKRGYRVHRLIMECFGGPAPPGTTVDHIDRDRSNNKFENLRWATPKEQSVNAERAGTYNSKRPLNSIDTETGDVLTFSDIDAAVAGIMRDRDQAPAAPDEHREEASTVKRKLYRAISSRSVFAGKLWSHTSSQLEWKNISPAVLGGLSGYSASRSGLIRLLNGRETAGHLRRTGYRVVCLGGKEYKVHRIIAATFCEHLPDEGSLKSLIVRHINDDPSDNRYDNLEYCTTKEARIHAVERGAAELFGGQAVEQISPEGTVVAVHESLGAARKAVHGDRSNLIACCRGRQKTAYGFRWRYAQVDDE